jgi:tRNA nucleotidyltransferase (CCA-adding enzyme)
MKTYLVGGAVRDQLLGLAVKERDWVVVGASPIEMLQLGYEPVGKFFPVFLHPETKEEYALARIERKVAGGYHGFTFDTASTVTLEEDLQRRDLTINAIAQAPDGTLIDPYGGKNDLKNKILRHVSPAFAEDPVRVLRIARFAARFAPLGFSVAPETLSLMREMSKKGELDFLVAERVWKEMQRALEEPSPVIFIRVLREAKALKIILPEIDRLYGVPQSLEHHPEKDTGIHIELVLQQACLLSTDPAVRFAALVHDVGKGLTPPELWPKHKGHEEKGEELVKALCNRLRVPNDYESLARLVTKYHGDCYRMPEANATEILTFLEKCDAFRKPERLTQFLLACEADFRGRPGFERAEFEPQKILSQALIAAQKVNVQEVIAGLASPQVIAPRPPVIAKLPRPPDENKKQTYLLASQKPMEKSQGERIKVAVYNARVRAIEEFLSSQGG